jgi:membrane protein implicated in regulation of membrane protease activity
MIWIMVGLGLCLLEIFTPGFFVMLFGVSAIITGVAEKLGLSQQGQWILFVVLCLVLIVFVRKYLVQMLDRQPTQMANVGGLIGKQATVIKDIQRDSLKGRVRIEGEDWIAITEEDTVFSSGSYVEVKSISGTKLIVGKGS